MTLTTQPHLAPLGLDGLFCSELYLYLLLFLPVLRVGSVSSVDEMMLEF
jgi:hypothetical protein